MSITLLIILFGVGYFLAGIFVGYLIKKMIGFKDEGNY